MGVSLNLKLAWNSVVQAGLQLAILLLQPLGAWTIGEGQHALFYISID